MVAPVVAVRGGGDGGVVVGEVLAAEEYRAVGQNDVVFREAFLDGGRGGHDHDEAGPEPEGEDGAEGLGEAAEGAVERWFEEVEVAYDWKRRWAWREVAVAIWC